MKTLTTTVARIIFGIPFLLFGLGHMFEGPAMADMIYHVSGTTALILNYIAGLGLILAALAILINKKAKLACLLLSLELLIFIVVLHIPKIMGVGPVEMFCDSTEMMAKTGFVHFFKDFALMGAALMFAGTLKD